MDVRAGSIVFFILGTLLGQSAHAQEAVNKDQWVAKMKSSERVEKTLCADDAFLMTCTTPFIDPTTKASTKLTKAACTEAVKEVVEASLATGNPVGVFYSRLPTNIGAGYQMDQFATELGKMIGTKILQAIVVNGGGMAQTEACTQAAAKAFVVSGN